MRAAAIVACLLLVSCGRVGSWFRLKDKDESSCSLMAQSWSPTAYLSWRRSANSKLSSVVYALPCSSEVASGRSLFGCTQLRSYYRVIGLQQFIAGWPDVTDSTGRRIKGADVDSVDAFASQMRDEYASCSSD